MDSKYFNTLPPHNIFFIKKHTSTFSPARFLEPNYFSSLTKFLQKISNSPIVLFLPIPSAPPPIHFSLLFFIPSPGLPIHPLPSPSFEILSFLTNPLPSHRFLSYTYLSAFYPITSFHTFPYPIPFLPIPLYFIPYLPPPTPHDVPHIFPKSPLWPIVIRGGRSLGFSGEIRPVPARTDPSSGF